VTMIHQNPFHSYTVITNSLQSTTGPLDLFLLIAACEANFKNRHFKDRSTT